MMRVIFLIVYCTLVYGKCQFKTDERTKAISDKMEKWNIDQTLTVSHNGLTYSVGICLSPDNSSTAIIQRGTNFSYVLGKLNQVNLVGEDNWILLTYENGDRYVNVCDNGTRSASIMLICGANKNDLTILQDPAVNDEHCHYMFKLQVPQMCPTEEKSKKLSGGAIFLIILFGLTTVYLVVGAVFLHIKRGARGLDHIPNLEMWRRLGNLAADGCDYCCRCERTTSRAGYFLNEPEADLHGLDDDILSP